MIAQSAISCHSLFMPRFVSAALSYRPNTEDRSVVLPVEEGWIVGVADGTGGISGGAKAAELFISGLRRAALSPNFNVADPVAWTTLAEALDDEIASDPQAGETTGVALAIASGLIAGASCGDSKAFLYTEVGWRELTRQQLRKPRLGTGRATARSFSVKAQGTLVVGTDGLFDYAKLDDMHRVVVPESAGAADALARLVVARHATPPDDIAVVVGWLD